MYFIHCFLEYVILIQTSNRFLQRTSILKIHYIYPNQSWKIRQWMTSLELYSRRINLLVVWKNDHTVNGLEGGKLVYMTHISIFLLLSQPSQFWSYFWDCHFPFGQAMVGSKYTAYEGRVYYTSSSEPVAHRDDVSLCLRSHLLLWVFKYWRIWKPHFPDS